MKKMLFLCFCVLFMAGTSVFGAYKVTGQVKDESGNPVNGATVYINCYPSSGGSYSATTTSGNVGGVLGFYTCNWPSYNCVGENMVVKATTSTKSGTKPWTAQYSVELNKDVTISTPSISVDEVHLEAEPTTIDEPSTLTPVPTNCYMQLTATPVVINGVTADMQYETQTMSCSSVESNPPFNDTFYYNINPVAGTIHVEAYATPGLYVTVENGENPTPLYTLQMEALPFTTPGNVSTIKTNSEITTDGGLISAFPSETEITIGEPNDKCNPYMRIDTQLEWTEALSSGHVYAMEANDWDAYMYQWQEFVVEGEPYPDDPFVPALPPDGQLYVYEGGGSGGTDPCDAGLVMYWGDTAGEHSSAWKFDYLLDPDLSNCTISVTVTAPPWVNQVSFGLQDPPILGGPIRAWYWNCGAAGTPIIWGTPTTVRIDTSKTGVIAATPTASAYMNNPGFTLTKVQWFIVDEDANWVGGGTPAPAPGSGVTGMWNYWHWLTVSPNTTLSKGYYTKWSQPPVAIDANDPPLISGWDEKSDFEELPMHIVADDWKCEDDRPVTDIHWWGSFIGWNQPYLPPVMPQAFHIGIWTDVPDPDPCDPASFSHPGMLVWENYCDNWVWNFAGYDKDPREEGGTGEPNDSCFQFNQLLSQDEWFYQEPGDDPNNPRIYWLSIAPVWGGGIPPYRWGWKTRPHYFNDDAVVIQNVDFWPPVAGGTNWTNGYPIQWPEWPDIEGISWDVSFELTTNEPSPIYNPMDFNKDGIVNLIDFATFANEWLKTGP